MSSVTLDGVDGRSLVLTPMPSPYGDADEPWPFMAELKTENATASSRVWEYGSAGPAMFFRELSAALSGWEGVKSYGSLEGELTLECRHDDRGLVVCEVTLGCVSPPTWRLAAEMTFGAGAHLERLADELEAAFVG